MPWLPGELSVDPPCDSMNDCALPSWAPCQGDRHVPVHTVDSTTAEGSSCRPDPPTPLRSRRHQTPGETEVSGDPTLGSRDALDPCRTFP